MTRTEFYILNNLYNASLGRARVSKDVVLTRTLKDLSAYKNLQDAGFIDRVTREITEAGLEALKPYKVDNAVIMAAGSATRFIPLSLEQPKGLYEVRDEKLIERQIKQLLAAGITDITIVLGYKKEMFKYLQDEFPVKFIFNPEYNVKNNIESLYLARKELKNTYICPCDSYYSENPFNAYEYESFYAGYDSTEKEDEMYAVCDEDNRILDMKKAENSGHVLLGHSFWRKDFSEKFVAIAEADREVGEYSDKFWEWLVEDNLSDLPAFYYKEYTKDAIFEFDYFDQLRQFDQHYVEHSNSEIIRNIKLIFRCEEEDIVDFRTVSEGMTNTSFIFNISGVDYIYRHPGDGTESIIDRRNEKSSLVKAKEFGLDPTYIYMDVNEGWKVSEYIPSFREPDYSDFEDSKKIIKVLRQLHSIPGRVDYGMKPWEDSISMENMIKDKDPHCFDSYEALKEKIRVLYEKTVGDGIEKCFCHGDTYKPNWLIKPDGEVVLIDWEYSGYSDPGIDVGYYIVDAMYDVDEAERFIKEYLADGFSDAKEFHFMAYTAIIAYYWFVWALYRQSCGAVMGEALTNWHDMAEKYADYLLK